MYQINLNFGQFYTWILNKGKLADIKLALFGASNLGATVLDELKKQDFQVACFFDNNQNKWGQTHEGLEIRNPQEVTSLRNDGHYIVITSDYHVEIARQLEQLGLRVEQDYFVMKDTALTELFGDWGSYFTPEEQAFLDRIEEQRNELHQCQDMLQRPPKTVAENCKSSSITTLHGSVLFRLLRQYKPETCIEMGTKFGISASFQGAALELNNKGKLYTIEINPELFKYSQRIWDQQQLSHRIEQREGDFDVVLEGILQELQPIDYIFVDGNHTKEATIRYFYQILPYLSENALIVFDDVNWSQGMREAWELILKDEHIIKSFESSRIGICIAKPGTPS